MGATEPSAPASEQATDTTQSTGTDHQSTGTDHHGPTAGPQPFTPPFVAKPVVAKPVVHDLFTVPTSTGRPSSSPAAAPAAPGSDAPGSDAPSSRAPAPAFLVSPTVPATPPSDDRREGRIDRRLGDRRVASDGRRRGDDAQSRHRRNLGWVGTLLGVAAVAFAVYAYRSAPVVFTPSYACNEGFGGQKVAHRQLSSLWVVVVVLAALGIALPDSRKRPLPMVLLCGAAVGLFIGAVLRIESWTVGFCLS